MPTHIQTFLQQLAQIHLPLLDSRHNALHASHTQWKAAAVLLAVVPKNGEWHIVLTERASHLRQHAGQIALAGGKRDENDESLTTTALREAQEEIGVPSATWQTFPAMQKVYSPAGFAITPIPALSANELTFHANENEVKNIFLLPVRLASDKMAYHQRVSQYQGKTFSLPALHFQGYEIWGVTACILYHLAELNRDYSYFKPFAPNQTADGRF
ncbi:MAG: CoA pyrophosphatase [Neisseria sp.]|nr:CoA pyrophosphatase [Neisseria sp.]